MENVIQIADQSRFLPRLVNAIESSEKLTLLLGSAITASPISGERSGIPSTSEIISKILEQFADTPEFDALNSLLRVSDSPSRRYQDAMRYLLECKGQSAVNELIRSAISNAYKSKIDIGNEENCEADVEGWVMRPGVESIAKLIKSYPECFTSPILTTNFDPLIEIALRKHLVNAAVNMLPQDGRIDSFHAPNSSVVVHLHGYWWGSDTLHTSEQLSRNRPYLKGSLRKILQNTTLIVVGYGGWDDVFTKTLTEVIQENSDQLNVLWCFHAEEENSIISEYGNILKSFENLAGQRVVFYKGIDCHFAFPRLLQRLEPHQNIEKKMVLGKGVEKQNYETCDAPPKVLNWIGREREVEMLLNQESKVVSITGFGGQGKSYLAAKYIDVMRQENEDIFWDWRDCREESNTIHNNIVRLIYRLNIHNNNLDGIEKTSCHQLVDLLFRYIGDREAIVVFDNVDHYVDVDKNQGTDDLMHLIEAATSRRHNSRFIFTCRPDLNFGHSSFLAMPLKGFSIQETNALFRRLSLVVSPEEELRIIPALVELTDGHPLWLNLIGVQAVRGKIKPQELLAAFNSRKEELLQLPTFMLKEIWETLNPKQQQVLRYIAETTRAENEAALAKMIEKELNYNQFSKAIKTLKLLHLVIIKSPASGPDIIELHPLVKQYLRRQYSIEDRKPFIQGVVDFFESLICSNKQIKEDLPLYILEAWTNKAELLAETGDVKSAIKALHEVMHHLSDRGFGEEFLRVASIIFRTSEPRILARADLTIFDSVLVHCIKTYTELGKLDDADKLISYFESIISGKTARYIALCSAKTYSYWLRGDYERAMLFGLEGVDTKTNGRIDTTHDCSHDYYLALRDSGKAKDALPYFLHGLELKNILNNTESKDLGGHYYGNVGRCLMEMDLVDEALICIKKSALILYANDGYSLMNEGYAALWLGELYKKSGKDTEAELCYKVCSLKWKYVTPLMGEDVLRILKKYDATFIPEQISDQEQIKLLLNFKNLIKTS